MADASAPNSDAFLSRAPLVGRERELSLLLAEFGASLSGEGRVLLLAGEPGIGKTRLADEFAAAAAARGGLVLWGRCHEAEWTPPYWPWVQALRAYAEQRPADALRAELGAGGADVAQLVPDIAARLPDLPALPTLAPEQARFRTFDHVAAFLRRAAAAQPLALILDDLHWADAPSLLLLEFIAREARTSPLLILGTYRDVEVGRQHPLARTVAELTRVGQSQRVALRGLNEAEVGRLVAAAGADPTGELVAAIYDETQGNPFFVHEIARLLASEGGENPGAKGVGAISSLPIPQSVREAIGRRLDRLSPATNETLAIAAAIGREFSLPVLARVSGQAPEQVLETLDEPTTARLIEALPGRVGAYQFAHALIRDTLYDELSTVQRVRLHRRIGLALETLYRSDLEPHLAELAHHFVQAAPGGDVQQAIAYARRAGERAMALLAFEDAATQAELALQVLDLEEAPDEALRCGLLLLLAAAKVNAGVAATGRALYLRAARLARATGLPDEMARAAIGYGGEPIAAWGHDAELVGLIEDALGLLGPEDGPARAQLLTRLAIEQDSVDPGRMASLVAEAEATARRLDDTRALAYALIGRIHVHLGRDDGWEALEATGRELETLGVAIDDRAVLWSAATCRLCGLLLAGDMAGADREIEACARIAAESRHPFYLFWTPTLYALRALTKGRFADAEGHIAEAVALAPRAHLAHWELWYAPNVFTLRREQGRLDEAEPTLRRVVDEDPNPEISSLAMLALAHLELGRYDEARRKFEHLAAADFAVARHQHQRGTNFVHGLGQLAELCAVFGDAPRAKVLYELLLPHAGRNLVYGGIWHVAGSASHYLGLLATILERWDDATRQFADALVMNDRMGARPFVARTQLAYAAMLARRDASGDRDQARSLADAALATADALGMVRVAAEAAALQAALEGLRVQDDANAAMRFGLTDRELAVLRLVVTGRSNPQIADALFISPATARTHVSNILAKLGVHSRTEAVDVAHRHGLLASSEPSST